MHACLRRQDGVETRADRLNDQKQSLPLGGKEERPLTKEEIESTGYRAPIMFDWTWPLRGYGVNRSDLKNKAAAANIFVTQLGTLWCIYCCHEYLASFDATVVFRFCAVLAVIIYGWTRGPAVAFTLYLWRSCTK